MKTSTILKFGRGPGIGRIRTLDHTGHILHTMGLSSQPLPAARVMEIERRAMRKLKKELGANAF